MATLPFQQSTSYKINRLVGKFNITVHIPAKNSSHMLRPVQDDLGLKSQESTIFHVNVKKWIQDRWVKPLKQRVQNMTGIYICISQTSPQWQNSNESGHQINFQQIEILAKISGYMDLWRMETQESMEQQYQIIKSLQCIQIGRTQDNKHREEEC
jgi:hypothetical protein